MYPNLTPPLLTLVAVIAVGLLVLIVRQAVARRLAARQVVRHRAEAALVIIGSVLGTAIIIGALVVGDTLNHSVRQDAYRTLGPIDERVTTSNADTGALAIRALQPLANDPRVDGVLSARFDQGAAAVTRAGARAAEPRVLVWDVDFAAGDRFGVPGSRSGLSGPTPEPGTVVINQSLARSLNVAAGQPITLYLYGDPKRLTVARVLPDWGVAGTGFGSTTNRNAFVPPGLLESTAALHVAAPQTAVFVSNRGDVESGNTHTAAVTQLIRQRLDGLVGSVTTETPKKDVLASAAKTGDTLGALFLMIGSFSIIAGALLLVNIFVMLAEERKSQLGMLRAIGMKRSRLVGSLTLEGSTYALLAVVPGVLVGIGVGYAVAQVAAQIFRTWSADGSGLAIAFAVTPVSIVNGAAMGLVISVATIVLTSIRISRFNVIQAIRDLPPTASQRSRRGMLIAGTTLTVLCAVAAVPAIATNNPVNTLLLPALAVLSAVPLMQRLMSRRNVANVAAGAVLVWTLVAPLVRPGIFDSPSMAVFVVLGVQVAFSAVVLVSQNQDVVVRPARRLIERPSQAGLATRLAVAYPLAKRFRTGATLVMYALITLVLVLLAEINGTITKSVDVNIARATGGYGVRVDTNPSTSQATFAALTTGPAARDITEMATLTSAPALAADPGRRTSQPLPAVVVGIPENAMNGLVLGRRLSLLSSDAAAWNLVAHEPSYVIIDQNFGSTGGPPGRFFNPGDTFTVVDPSSGRITHKTIAGIMGDATVFYPVSGDGANRWPVLASQSAVQQQFAATLSRSSALLRLAPGVDPVRFGAQLQGTYLGASLVATPLASKMHQLFSANTAFFRLMQGFLALGLLVGVTGLGVVMVRAVRERRRTIGVLRALGFRATTVARSFLIESGLIAVEGIVVGSVLGVLTTWLMYQKSASFNGIRSGFPITWSVILLLGGATLVTSLLVTIGPARRAAQVRPALAVRVAD